MYEVEEVGVEVLGRNAREEVEVAAGGRREANPSCFLREDCLRAKQTTTVASSRMMAVITARTRFMWSVCSPYCSTAGESCTSLVVGQVLALVVLML